MKVQCAWCKKFGPDKAPLEDTSVSHTICPGCTKKVKGNPPIEWMSVEGVSKNLDHHVYRVVGKVRQYLLAHAGKWELIEVDGYGSTPKQMGTFDTQVEAMARAGISAAKHLTRSNPGGIESSLWIVTTLKTGKTRILNYLESTRYYGRKGYYVEIYKNNPGEAWHAGKMEEAERSEKAVKKPSLKDFYHGKAIAHFESALQERATKRARRNPLAVFTVGNPPESVQVKVAGIVYNRVHEVKAEKTGRFRKGLWRHPFEKSSQVQLLALDNGDLLLRSLKGTRLWKLA